jgi:hypothetical protein
MFAVVAIGALLFVVWHMANNAPANPPPAGLVTTGGNYDNAPSGTLPAPARLSLPSMVPYSGAGLPSPATSGGMPAGSAPNQLILQTTYQVPDDQPGVLNYSPETNPPSGTVAPNAIGPTNQQSSLATQQTPVRVDTLWGVRAGAGGRKL